MAHIDRLVSAPRERVTDVSKDALLKLVSSAHKTMCEGKAPVHLLATNVVSNQWSTTSGICTFVIKDVEVLFYLNDDPPEDLAPSVGGANGSSGVVVARSHDCTRKETCEDEGVRIESCCFVIDVCDCMFSCQERSENETNRILKYT